MNFYELTLSYQREVQILTLQSQIFFNLLDPTTTLNFPPLCYHFFEPPFRLLFPFSRRCMYSAL
jgi:hypothetical protein